MEVELDDFADAIFDIVKKTCSEVTKDVIETLDEHADLLVQELQDTSPDKTPKKSGRYAKGWVKEVFGLTRIIRNKKEPGLTHILEHGRLEGDDPEPKHAKPHIARAANKILSKLEDKLK